jgi:hypothetical protein
MKTENFVGHHEARQALALSVAGVMAIILITNFILLILYWALLKQQSRRQYAVSGFAFPQYVPSEGIVWAVETGWWSDALTGNGRKPNEATYFVRRRGQRTSVLVVESREAQAQDLIPIGASDPAKSKVRLAPTK